MKKAIKIDVINRSIYEVEITKEKNIYHHIGNGCNTFECPVQFENGDAIYCDEEGLYHEIHGCFVMEGWKHPIVGNAIILGTDNEGDSINHKTTLEEIAEKLIFGSKELAIDFIEAKSMSDAYATKFFPFSAN